MRADIHGGPEQKLQSEAGYIDARPQTDSSTKTSCNARPDHTFGSKAVLGAFLNDVRFSPTNRHPRSEALGPISAIAGSQLIYLRRRILLRQSLDFMSKSPGLFS